MKTLFLSLCLFVLPLTADDTNHPIPEADTELPEGSLYVFESTWTDHQGNSIRWATGMGKPRVVALGYATCKGICPRVIADMQRIENELDEDSKAVFTFISLDPENDKAPEMQALADNHKLDLNRWELLMGDDEGVLELAVALGIRFDRLPDGVNFAHSYLIAILDPDGKVVYKWKAPNEGPKGAIDALKVVEKQSATLIPVREGEE